ncbi:MAG: ergothioneine biosynthesis protein EgtB [Alphaproteobacteria bacterium]|nr:ergothioneine biosynthesis protein EgtB [Alphaproteobacteria bacterium]
MLHRHSHDLGLEPTHMLDQALGQRLMECRRQSLRLVEPLSDEDMVVQAMDDASPAKWHLAHTTWFYEAFALQPYVANYAPYSRDFAYCFNSYYETKGERHPRPHRGLLTRPTAKAVFEYRQHVDDALSTLFESESLDPETQTTLAHILEIGINHEQQHQELLLTDILALFARQPLHPAYSTKPRPAAIHSELQNGVKWLSFRGGVSEIGHSGPGFSYDNEGPRHHVLIHPFKLADRPVTNGEWQTFISDGGYADPLLWLAEGWDVVQKNNWDAPEYWHNKDDTWHQMTLHGSIPVEPSAPVSHISYYEADAFARWAGKRLPTEFEWEVATADLAPIGNTLGNNALRPVTAASQSEDKPQQMFGDVWEWTASSYQAYPGYQAPEGALGEYNGKFMCSQYVLRGGSCVTPDGHIRPTYRNFFYPHQRWQFSGVRLADNP